MFRIFLFAVSIVVFALLAGCAAYRAEGSADSLRRSDSTGTVVHGKETYYVVKAIDLRKARKGPPTYVGSIETYHLFRVWLKTKDSPDEISFFAVKRGTCTVEDEKSPQNEEVTVSATRKGWREVEFKNGKCFVKGESR